MARTVKPCDEGDAEAKAAKNPSRDCNGTDEIGTEIGGCWARGLGCRGVQFSLEVRVKDVEEAVREAPKERRVSSPGDKV
jgi:hypothetical protein